MLSMLMTSPFHSSSSPFPEYQFDNVHGNPTQPSVSRLQHLAGIDNGSSQRMQSFGAIVSF